MVSFPVPPLTSSRSPLSAWKIATGAEAPLTPTMPALEKTVMMLVAGRGVNRDRVHLAVADARADRAFKIDLDRQPTWHRSR